MEKKLATTISKRVTKELESFAKSNQFFSIVTETRLHADKVQFKHGDLDAPYGWKRVQVKELNNEAWSFAQNLSSHLNGELNDSSVVVAPILQTFAVHYFSAIAEANSGEKRTLKVALQNDLQRAPLYHRLRHYVVGLHVSFAASFRFGDCRFSIREPTLEELDGFVKYPFGRGYSSPPTVPTAVIEGIVFEQFPPKLHDAFERLLLGLELLLCHPVRSVRNESGQSSIGFNGGGGPMSPDPVFEHVTVDREEFLSLLRSIRLLQVPSSSSLGSVSSSKNEQRNGALLAALAYFRDGLTASNRAPGYRVAACVHGLEGLLVKGKSEVSFQFRQNLATLTNSFGICPHTAYNVAKSLYGARSAFSHGGKEIQKELLKTIPGVDEKLKIEVIGLRLLRMTIIAALSFQLDIAKLPEEINRLQRGEISHKQFRKYFGSGKKATGDLTTIFL